MGGLRFFGIKMLMILYICVVFEGCELGGCLFFVFMVFFINLWFSGRG